MAIKVINRTLADDPAYLEALQREARLAAGLDHPNITTVHDFQFEGDSPYLVMEYVPDSLDKHLRGRHSLPQDQAVQIAIQICKALEYAHSNGVIHRDIKPQNILLTEDGIAKVSDFGIARAIASSTQSRTTRAVGTPFYMAPEQWTGSPADAKADIYSLGVLLYELLTGSPPFQGDSVEAIYVQHRETPVPPIPSDRGVPKVLEDVVRRAMEKRHRTGSIRLAKWQPQWKVWVRVPNSITRGKKQEKRNLNRLKKRLLRVESLLVESNHAS